MKETQEIVPIMYHIHGSTATLILWNKVRNKSNGVLIAYLNMHIAICLKMHIAYLSFCPFNYLSIYRSIYLSIYPSISISISIYPSVCLSINIWFYLGQSISVSIMSIHGNLSMHTNVYSFSIYYLLIYQSVPATFCG